MVGVSDLYAWSVGKSFAEVSPTEVKALLVGKGSASKEEVAAALTYYVGKQEYHFDDESDAVAVAIAWLIREGYLDRNPEVANEQRSKEDPQVL